MLNTEYITYDDVISTKFGLQLGSFDGESGAQDIAIYSPEITTSKSYKAKRFNVTSNDVNTPPEYEISLISESLLSTITIRNVMRWLSGDGQFKKLVINRQDLQDYYYMCVFKNIQQIKVNGYCVGFKMTAVLDSHFQYGKPEQIMLNSANYNAHEIQIINKSDIDEYVYPQIKFKLADGASTIKIINMTDDSGRVFEMNGLPSGVETTIDNELKIVSGGASLDNFTSEPFTWVRLKRGLNILQITLNGEFDITCPQYCMIGF